jgi:hypothetical protein
MNIKSSFTVSIRTVLLITPLLGGGCQMLGNTSVAGDFIKTEQAPVSDIKHIPKPSLTPAHGTSTVKPVPKKPNISSNKHSSDNDLHDIANQAIKMAEKQATSSRSTVISQQNTIVMQSGNNPPDATTWTDLSAIAAKSIQIAEDQTEHGNTGTTAYQAELRRMMEQHFRQ